MTGFNLNDYEPVEARLQKYLSKYPDARVITKVEHQDETRILIRAIIYKNAEELEKKLPHATGFAEETRGEGYVNKTSHVENCETSALGRALANAGYSGNKNGQRASREEMTKVQRMEDPIMEVTKDIKTKFNRCPECQGLLPVHKPSCSEYGK